MTKVIQSYRWKSNCVPNSTILLDAFTVIQVKAYVGSYWVLLWGHEFTTSNVMEAWCLASRLHQVSTVDSSVGVKWGEKAYTGIIQWIGLCWSITWTMRHHLCIQTTMQQPRACVFSVHGGETLPCVRWMCGTYLLREVERASSGLQITCTFTAANKLHRLDV